MVLDPQEIEARSARLGSERLAAELLDLASQDGVIERRVKLLIREGDPGALGTDLSRRIAGLERASRFVSYRESSGLASELREIVAAIEGMVPVDPVEAFELADSFVATDAKTFGRVDDSAGVVADVYRDACRLWLRAAAGSAAEKDWVDRIYTIAAGEGYGVRERLLQEAATD